MESERSQSSNEVHSRPATKRTATASMGHGSREQENRYQQHLRGEPNITENEYDIQRQARNERRRAAYAIKKANESSEETELRLQTARNAAANRRANESSEERELRLQTARNAKANRRANESSEERELRLQTRKANESQEQKEARNERRRTLYAAKKANEPPEQSVNNINLGRIEMQENNIEEHSCGTFNEICELCGSLNFKSERPPDKKFTLCCQKGKVVLPPLHEFPVELKSLMDGSDQRSKNFMDNVRSYNCALAFASFGADIATPPGHGPYCFRLHGQIYHRVGTLHPAGGDAPKYAQLYFLDPEEALRERMSIRENSNCDPDLMRDLDRWLREWNGYANMYLTLREVEESAASHAARNNLPVPNICMALRHDRGQDPRRYNSPVVNEVAVIFQNQDGEPPLNRDILIHNRPDPNDPDKTITKRLNILDPMVDPLSYPILFPFADQGWRVNLPFAVCLNKREFVSQMQYYQYRFAIRQEFNPLICAGKLTQQYAVDSYVRIEASRLNYIRQHQTDLRCEYYQGLVDEVNSRAEKNGLMPGKPLILPSSFGGSPRNMFQNYQDAMSIVQKFGKPDIFLTMTCNPKWKEISENLQNGQRPEYRPDLIARVFNLKLKSMLDDIMKKKIFGEVIAKIHVIEFQKRGLPHAHLLIILGNDSKLRTAEDIDKVVTAEIPDPDTEPRLHQIVLKHMIHGPCGLENPNSPCMVDGSCSKGYPKHFNDHTKENLNGYPLYRRRQANRAFFVGNKKVDNRWVVPYNKFLSLRYDCHINIEICASVKSVKYLFKYVYKGHDRAVVEITQHDGILHHDEIKMFLDTRYVSAPEAMWRIFSFDMHQQSHTVVRLPVHLENYQMVTFHPGQISNAISSSEKKGTKLTAWFKLNELDETARQYFYWQIPEHYIYEKDNNSRSGQYHWRPRKLMQHNTIGRMYAVNIADMERFSLRLLLLHVRGATSFDDLQTVNGTICDSFTEAARKKGLLADDEVWHQTLLDAENCDMPYQLRQLFAFICHYGSASNILDLWERHKEKLMEDIVYQHALHDHNCSICENLALRDIEQTLLANGSSCRKVGLPQPCSSLPEDRINAFELDHARTVGEEMKNSLNAEQRNVFDAILSAIDDQSSVSKCFFLDGVGGSGKTYLYQTLIQVIYSRSSVVLPVASTGIAADLLKNASTVHSQFRMPLNLNETSVSEIRKRSKEAEVIRQAKLIIWDESTMSLGLSLSFVDRLLRDIMNNEIPFGGKVILLGGDFRQTLPVVPHGDRVDIVQKSIKRNTLWPLFRHFKLSTNVRCPDKKYNDWLEKLGTGELENHYGLGDDVIEIPAEFITKGSIVDEVFGENLTADSFSRHCSSRAILCPKNDDVDKINEQVLEKFDGQPFEYLSVDTVNADVGDEISNLPIEFINSLTPSGYPPHCLKLKVGTIIMCLRNLQRKRGLSNGTRLIVKQLRSNVIQAEILTGSAKGQTVLLPRIDLTTKDHPDIPFELRRRQFPVKLSFAMTINKSQGQTLDKVGIYLRDPVFAHGQLYTAFSRVKRACDVKVKVEEGPGQGKLLKRCDKIFTRNIVYKEIFNSN